LLNVDAAQDVLDALRILGMRLSREGLLRRVQRDAHQRVVRVWRLSLLLDDALCDVIELGLVQVRCLLAVGGLSEPTRRFVRRVTKGFAPHRSDHATVDIALLLLGATRLRLDLTVWRVLLLFSNLALHSRIVDLTVYIV